MISGVQTTGESQVPKTIREAKRKKKGSQRGEVEACDSMDWVCGHQFFLPCESSVWRGRATGGIQLREGLLTVGVTQVVLGAN